MGFRRTCTTLIRSSPCREVQDIAISARADCSLSGGTGSRESKGERGRLPDVS